MRHLGNAEASLALVVDAVISNLASPFRYNGNAGRLVDGKH